MTSFRSEFDKLSADWHLQLTMVLYTRGSPYAPHEMDLISTTFDQQVKNLFTIFAVSFNTELWDVRLHCLLSHCNSFLLSLISTIHSAKPHASFLLPLLHIYFASLYASCVTAYFCTAQ